LHRKGPEMKRITRDEAMVYEFDHRHEPSCSLDRKLS